MTPDEIISRRGETTGGRSGFPAEKDFVNNRMHV